ncbi:MAG: hypothetical protein AAFO85_11885 [Cyanobacteria bacterium J06598_4]
MSESAFPYLRSRGEKREKEREERKGCPPFLSGYLASCVLCCVWFFAVL